MNTKKLGILGGLLFLVVAIIFLSEKLGSKNNPGKIEGIFPSIPYSNVATFYITKDGKTLTIKRSNDGWIVINDKVDVASLANNSMTFNPAKDNDQVAGQNIADQFRIYPADSASVVSALEKISSITAAELISKNPEKRQVFKVDSASAIIIQPLDAQGSTIATFFVGKNGPSWSTNYVRLKGSDNVYNAGGSIKQAFFTEAKRWRSKSIVKFDPSTAQKITVAHKDSATTILEKSVDSTGLEIWKITAPVLANADQKQATALLLELADFETGTWLEKDTLTIEQMGLDIPEIVVTAFLDGGIKKEVYIGKNRENSSKFFVKVPGNAYIFEAYRTNVEKISKPLEELRAKEEKVKKDI